MVERFIPKTTAGKVVVSVAAAAVVLGAGAWFVNRTARKLGDDIDLNLGNLEVDNLDFDNPSNLFV